MILSLARTKKCLIRCRKRSIAVVGDLMLDRYVYGTVSRISPEAPVPVVLVRDEKNMPGGACNVAANIRAMGGACVLCGWMGRDPAGRDLHKVLSARGVGMSGAVCSPSVHTTVKTRIIAERQQVVRVDQEDREHEIPASVRSRFLARLLDEVGQADGVILEDYGKGVVTQDAVDLILKVAHRRGIPVGFDPKDDHPVCPRGITVATPNRKEAFACADRKDPGAGPDPRKDRALLEVGARLMELWSPKHLFITLGPLGMLLMESGAAPIHVPTRAREVFDVSGAGDTVIAVSTLALSAGASGAEAAEIANFAAGVVVGKIGTAICSPDELLAFMQGNGIRSGR
jgi:D-beta-D-heptose 7-phosphate kinase/D-beta-D-heptose 1-phosphate adenosyltransferase